MLYVISILLCLGFLLFAPPSASAEKRTGGRQSSRAELRKPQKYNLKPLVYDPKKHRAQSVKKHRWWHRR
jgi:hypothetical protein